TLGCVVFRYRPCAAGSDADALNEALRRRLFDRGEAVIGHTRIRGQNYLKLTFLNPCLDSADVARLLPLVVEQGNALERESQLTRPAWAAAPGACAPRC